MKKKNSGHGTLSRLTALLLTGLMLLPLAACSQDNGNVSTDDTTADSGTSADTTTAAETSDPAATLDLPEMDFDGADFNIAYIYWTLYNGNIISDEENGDTINDAVYERTRLTEEHANVNLTMTDLGQVADIQPKLAASVMAGDDAYQLLLSHCIGGVAAPASEGLVENWNTIPYVDFTKNWWKKSANENLSIAGIQTHVVSEFIRSDPTALLFNIGMIEDFSLEDPYELVFGGTWTWDKLSEMALEVVADIDGDGQMTKDDRYGFVGSHGWEILGVPHSCGQLTMEKDADGVPQIVFNNDKMISIFNMFYNLLYDGKNRAFTWKSNRDNDPNLGGTPPVDFGAGHALFFLLPLTSIPNYRATEIDFGVLPFPKYDDAQEKYLSLDWSGLMCVPKGADTELVGYVTELLSYYSVETTVPAWYDTLLTDKITRDENSVKVLDIIYDNLVYDFGLNYSENFNTMFYTMTTLIASKNNNFTSYYESIEQKAIEHYTGIYEKIIENYQ